MVPTIVHTLTDELRRLTAADLAAEELYQEAMRSGDMSAARVAADELIRAADALADYIARHSQLHRRTGD
ncbi:MAG: hypothetical protein WDM77_22420 [Steroidobacteraceae bacterium]